MSSFLSFFEGGGCNGRSDELDGVGCVPGVHGIETGPLGKKPKRSH